MSSKKALAWNLLVPFLMLLVSEGVTGNLLRLFAPGVVLGTAVYYILYLGVFFFAGTTKVSWLLLNLAVYGLAAGEYFVISFRERPAMIWDVLALRTAMTVSANYRFTVTPRLVFYIPGHPSFGNWFLEGSAALGKQEDTMEGAGSLGRCDCGLCRAALRRFDAGP